MIGHKNALRVLVALLVVAVLYEAAAKVGTTERGERVA
ncbi:hypothetical protein Hmuk_0833 [Halomicrobium mukohataei DSM 12286]|uniref:Uncharacterized protein n=1 Tax=Halomicrobium mukohataei (strain ATCC 700874 / DSM 12286 / JCM 9738 / NCIMB 13541) TaxID=485914 RepID=C7P0I2_HALMD|nr:hypothetical protein Hmuk_0833 [Halomicrobium mukohataei DSM 12286]